MEYPGAVQILPCDHFRIHERSERARKRLLPAEESSESDQITLASHARS